jgi:hypothetical protein
MSQPKAVFHIKIDKTDLDIPASESPIAGSELRKRGNVPEGFDLWLKRPGDDALIDPTEQVPLKDGMHFYSAKSVFTPG